MIRSLPFGLVGVFALMTAALRRRPRCPDPIRRRRFAHRRRRFARFFRLPFNPKVAEAAEVKVFRAVEAVVVKVFQAVEAVDFLPAAVVRAFRVVDLDRAWNWYWWSWHRTSRNWHRYWDRPSLSSGPRPDHHWRISIRLSVHVPIFRWNND